ncbi:MDR family MFS transporter [Telmatospirillum siberiense]|uniref:MFS-type drug efflux transporter P55 n=1 Tax=Telmatospirillum siberiense TaxID=382514 RepID=A0A2N3PUG8_9PROT|nr:MDR family MFS transporter [Telmatospirillum siberiense]PKU24051.1 MFS transporter [Telmatospirillum siberiense]
MPDHPSSLRPLIVASVMMSMFMVAMEATIVSTAMPQIVAQLGGLRLYSWVFSSFLLTQTAATVIFGKLADLYGRKPVMLAGIGIFLVGSLFAGFAWSMSSMVLFRLIQGVGAGAIMPVALTIIGDLYPARERGKVQGYLASVWAFSAVVGPMIGAFIVTRLSWAWIFWINLPIGLAAAGGFAFFLREEARQQRPSIDLVGAGLFTCAIAALMGALTDIAAIDRTTLAALVAVFFLCLALFVIQERRARDPIISFDLWKRRAIAAANGAALIIGMVLMGLTTFLPMYVQGVLHRSPVVAGLALTMVMVGWPCGATFTARAFPRLGLRPILLAGGVLLPIGAGVFVFLTRDSSPVLAGVGSLLMGLAMGFVSVSSLVLIQEIVEHSERGSATASNLFARNLGSTLGAAVFGGVLNYGLSHTANAGSVTSEQLKELLQAGTASVDAALQMALQHSLHITFCAMFVIALISIVVTLLVPSAVTRRIGQAPAEAIRLAPLDDNG